MNNYQFTKIADMAADRKTLKSKLNNLNDMIAIHFLKLNLFKNNNSQSHWKEEIANLILANAETKLKPKSNQPTSDFYYNELFTYSFDEPNDITMYLSDLFEYDKDIMSKYNDDIISKIGNKYLTFAKLCSDKLAEGLTKSDREIIYYFLDTIIAN